jgi:RimJ/RimL family protein N-acetyltransferase
VSPSHLSPRDLDGLVEGEVRLRLPRSADVDRLTEICQDPAIQRFTRVPSPYEHHHAHAFVEAATNAVEQGSGVPLLAVSMADESILGAVGLDIDPAELSAELGYWVAPEARGRGVALRGCRLLCRLGFDRLGLGHVLLQISVTNPASRRVAERLGCALEGRRRRGMLDGPSGDASSPRVDAELWGLLPEELR